MKERKPLLEYIKHHRKRYTTGFVILLFIIGMIGYANYNKHITKQEVVAEVKKEALENRQLTTLAVSNIASNKYVTAEEVQIITLSMYPVGSLYISTNNTNPSQYIGGSWERYGNGKTLVGVNESETEFASVGKTGGEKSHTLTIAEMPSHSHTLKSDDAQFGSTGWENSGNFMRSRQTNYTLNTETQYKGGSQAHNNLQPYITIYIWKRTS